MTSKPTPKHAKITAQTFVLANTRDWQYRALKVVDPVPIHAAAVQCIWNGAARVTDVPNTTSMSTSIHNSRMCIPFMWGSLRLAPINCSYLLLSLWTTKLQITADSELCVYVRGWPGGCRNLTSLRVNIPVSQFKVSPVQTIPGWCELSRRIFSASADHPTLG